MKASNLGKLIAKCRSGVTLRYVPAALVQITCIGPGEKGPKTAYEHQVGINQIEDGALFLLNKIEQAAK